MNRIVVLGRGAAGKSAFASALHRATGIPCVELDTVFWSSDLRPVSQDEWRHVQVGLVAGDRWILDGDLGPYDAPDVRLRRADTVVLFDRNAFVCAWRAIRRSRERRDFWQWLVLWRVRYRPAMLRAVRTWAPRAELFVIRNRRDEERARRHIVRAARPDGGASGGERS
jgi:adenylate kinase family enzyme